MQLNNWIANNVPQAYRGLLDYESGAGWVSLVNRLLKKLEIKGLYNTTKKKERGVEVDSDYWITPPSDMRQLYKVTNPFDPNNFFTWDNLNGKIKINRSFSKDSDPDTFTLSEGSTTTIKINDADATADLWNEYLLVLTDGTYSGETIVIHDTAAADTGTSILTFRHAQAGSIDSTTGYLTKDYLMLKYKSTFTTMAAYNGEIPLDDKYEDDLLLFWLLMNSVDVTDKRFPTFKSLFDEALNDVKNEQQTPAPDQARPEPIPWPRQEIGHDGDGYNNYEIDKDWD